MTAETALLWTGGFDSTFRLLDLVLDRAQPVRPVYVVDISRRSWWIEIEAQHAILTSLERRDPAARARVLGHRYVDRKSLTAEPATDEPGRAYLRHHGIGQQYLWLGRVPTVIGDRAVEVLIDRGGATEAMLAAHVVPADDGDPWRHRLRADAPAELACFRDLVLAFPPVAKPELAAEATRRGYDDLLALCWTCYRPLDGRPCGVCAPCRHARADGHGARLARTRLPKRRDAIPQMTYRPGRTPPPRPAARRTRR